MTPFFVQINGIYRINFCRHGLLLSLVHIPAVDFHFRHLSVTQNFHDFLKVTHHQGDINIIHASTKLN